jgi:hypothetical protein
MLLRCAALLLLCACPGPTPPPPEKCVPPRLVGDLSQPLQLLPISLDAAGTLHALQDGDTVLLQKPPQGGYVIYAGAAARNLEACAAVITAQLVDVASGAPITGLDQRNVNFTVASAGYFWPSNGFTQTPNIPSCPDALHQGVVGRSAILRADVTDASQRTARVEVRVKPVCAADDSRCPCICGPNPSGC